MHLYGIAESQKSKQAIHIVPHAFEDKRSFWRETLMHYYTCNKNGRWCAATGAMVCQTPLFASSPLHDLFLRMMRPRP